MNHLPNLINMGSQSLHGSVPEEHLQHRRLWILNLHQGEGFLEIDGHRQAFFPGDATWVPAGIPYHYQFHGPSKLSFLHFVPVCRGTPVMLPSRIALGFHFESLHERITRCAPIWTREKSRAHALLWETLWTLRDLAHESGTSDSPHPAVRHSLREIEMHLAEPLYTDRLARQVGLSKTHLNRLFHKTLGVAVQEHIRLQRCRRARVLLEETTLSIKEIGLQVGIPDPHLFNKTLRRVLGKSPISIRKRGR
ncbi:MAG: AraC family transcriptional regulator [Verrucomicrobiae bacterium]|nr:AraC family transcriptional regulator [Verrucomicrobiae bacterium]